MQDFCYSSGMSISVLIIAHNEEKHIAQCINSVLNQTVHTDEIVLIAHNCTDQTETIARSFPGVKVVSYQGSDGAPYARIKGFEEVTGDIIACIDGDSVAHPSWLKHISQPLIDTPHVSLVAGYVILTNNLWSRITSAFQFIWKRKILRQNTSLFAWGSNFACRKNDYARVGGIAPVVSLKETLSLHFWAEDLYISRALMQIGRIHIALTAKTYTTLPCWKLDLHTAPLKQWQEDNRKVVVYFENKNNQQ